MLIGLSQKLYAFHNKCDEGAIQWLHRDIKKIEVFWDFGLRNLLEDVKLYISMIYHLICSTLVNIEGAYNFYNFRFLSFVQMHIFARKKSSAVLYYGFWLKSHA